MFDPERSQVAGWPRQWGYFNAVKNSNKIWRMCLQDAGGGQYWVRTEYGPAGGKLQHKDQPRPWTMAQVRKKIAEQEREGYVEQQMAQPDTRATSTARPPQVDVEWQALDPRQDQVIRLLLDEAQLSLDSFLAAPGALAQIGPEQVRQARRVLRLIAQQREYINGRRALGTDRQLQNLTTEYYTMIPTRLTRPLDIVRETLQLAMNVAQHERRLDQIMAALRDQGRTADTVATALARTLEPIDVGFSDLAGLVRRWVAQALRVGYTPRIDAAFAVHNEHDRQRFTSRRFDPAYVMPMVYDAEPGQIRQVIEDGLHLPMERVADSAVGCGLEFSRDVTALGQQQIGRYGDRPKLILVAQVALRDTWETRRPLDGDRVPLGYATMWGIGQQTDHPDGAGDSTLPRDVFGVYDPAYHHLSHLIVWR